LETPRGAWNRVVGGGSVWDRGNKDALRGVVMDGEET